MNRVMIISSDGHATACMDDYKSYLPASYHEEFDAFCEVYRAKGSRNFDRVAMVQRTDPEVVDDWMRNVVDEGRANGDWDPQRRRIELDREGVAAEVIFPEFGIPFELYPPFVLAALAHPQRRPDQIEVGDRAYNRWLVDFCSTAPSRFAGMALVRFDDIEKAQTEIQWAKEAGLKGVIHPVFDDHAPLFSPRYEPIWSTLEDLDMPLNSHLGLSSTSSASLSSPIADLPHPAAGGRMLGNVRVFFCHNILNHLIWGGVLERHPNLKVVFTEQGSGWVSSELRHMDHSYEGSYMRRDVREIVRMKPSDYFERQCFLGSSIFSKSEVELRHQIGLNKMMMGVDYPHFEGTWTVGTLDYLQATFGAAHVPENEARLMLGETAARVFGFDIEQLKPVVERIGPPPEEVLREPTEEKFARGDVHRPA